MIPFYRKHEECDYIEFCQQVGIFFLMLIMFSLFLLFAVFQVSHLNWVNRLVDPCLEYSPEDCGLNYTAGEIYNSQIENCFVTSDNVCRSFFFTLRAGCGLGPAKHLISDEKRYYKSLQDVKAKCIELECAVWTWNSPTWRRDCAEGCVAFFWNLDTWDDYDMLVIGDDYQICRKEWQQGKPVYGYTTDQAYLETSDFDNCIGGPTTVNSTNISTPSLASYHCRKNEDDCNFWYWEDLGSLSYKMVYCRASDTPALLERGINQLPGHIEEAELLYAEVGYDAWEYEHAHENTHPVFDFLLLSLCAGSLMKWLQTNVPGFDKVPFTVYILLVGMGGVLLVEKFHAYFNYDSHLAMLFRMVNNIDPHFLLMMFIPPLIFESSFSTSYHTISAEKGQALILAGPGVLIAAFATAALSWGIYGNIKGYWDFKESLLFGSIVSATDPVAVVALLKELGASVRLSTLIEAESLLNDGTAFVLWSVVLKAVQKDPIVSSASGIIWFTIQLVGGGVSIGFGLALMCLWWLHITREDSQIEITVTILGSYIAFYLAEQLICSGILAVVVFGLMLSKYDTCFSPGTEHSLHVVWNYMGWLANVMIFLISGAVLNKSILYGESVFSQDWKMLIREFGWGILLYIVIHIARAIAIGLCYPFLKRTGYGVDWKSAVIMWAAGLRGAIGLALALMTSDVAFSTLGFDGPSEKLAKGRILFHVCLFALLTLLINGIFIRYLLEFLGMTNFTKTAGIVYAECLDHIENLTKNQIKHMQGDQNWRAAAWKKVVESLPDFGQTIAVSNPDIQKSLKIIDTNLKAIDIEMHPLSKSKTLLDFNRRKKAKSELQHDLKDEIRFRYLSVFRAEYREMYEHGYCSGKVFRILTEAAEKAMDIDVDLIKKKFAKSWINSAKDPVGKCEDSWQLTGLSVHYRLIMPYFELPTWVRKLWNSTKRNTGNAMESCIKAVLPPRLLVDSYISFGTEVALAFLEASRKVTEILKDFPELVSTIDTSEMFHGATVAQEHSEIERKIIEVIQNLEDGYGDIVKRVKTKQALMTILHHQRRYIKKTKNHGILQEKEFLEIEELILDCIHKINRREENILHYMSCGLIKDSSKLFDLEEEKPENIFNSSPVIKEMESGVRKKMFTLSNPKLPQVGDEILKNDRPDMFVVLKGIVVVKTRNSDVIETMPKGSIIGAYRYLSKDRPIYKFSAKTVVEGRRLDRNDLDEVCKEYREVMEAIAKQAGLELLKARYLKLFRELLQMDTHICQIMMNDSDVVTGDMQSRWEGNLMLLLTGELQCERLEIAEKASSDLIARAPTLITKCRGAKWHSQGILLVLHPERAKARYKEGDIIKMSKMRVLQAGQLTQFIDDNSNDIDIDKISHSSEDERSLKGKLKLATDGIEFF